MRPSPIAYKLARKLDPSASSSYFFVEIAGVLRALHSVHRARGETPVVREVDSISDVLRAYIGVEPLASADTIGQDPSAQAREPEVTPRSLDPKNLLGSNIGPYKLLDVLGDGGMGVVYLAEQRAPIRRRVAFKLIKRGMDTAEVIARFEAERQALALMSHPNIAKVHEAGPSDAGKSEDGWQLGILRELVQDHEAIQKARNSDRSIARAWRKMDRLRSLENASSMEAWKTAMASILDKAQCPMYEGLVIKPQFGLVPIGKNEVSGLWDFVDLLTGEAPKRGWIAVHKLPEMMNSASFDDVTKTWVAVRNQMEVQHVAGLVVTEDTGIVHVLVPGGTFIMGSPQSEAGRRINEDQHNVTLGPFLISKYEVTQAQWQTVMAVNPSRFGGATLPVENISWNDAEEFCRKTRSRLPEAAQWEYACRGGSTGPYGLEESSSQPGTVLYELDEIAWFTIDKQKAPLATNPVGGKRPNAFGLLDMHGNVWEWCEDVYTDEGMMLQVEASRPASNGGERVIRGGYHGSRARECRCSYLTGSHVTDRLDRGLRPVRTLQP